MTTASKPAGSHIQGGLPKLQGDRGFQEEVDFNKTLGNDRLIIAMGNARTVDQWTKMADDFSAVAAKLKPLGLRLGYHNHTAEFTAVDGQVPEYLFFDKASPDVFVQLDVGHCLHAGGDPVAVIKKYPTRLVTMHIKDYNPTTRGDIVGEGSVKWPDVLVACAACPNLQWSKIEENEIFPTILWRVRPNSSTNSFIFYCKKINMANKCVPYLSNPFFVI